MTIIYSSRWGTTQVVDFTSVSVALTTAFGSQTRQVRLAANAACHVKVGDGAQTATSTSPMMHPQGGPEIITVSAGQSLAAIRASGGNLTSVDGRLTVTEIS